MLNGISPPRPGQRGTVYLAMLAVCFVSPVADSLAGTAYSTDMTWADFAFAIILVALTAWWCTADARQGGYRPPGGLARILVLLFMPLGLAVYLLQARTLPRAAGAFVLYMGGMLAATIAGGELGDWMVPPPGSLG